MTTTTLPTRRIGDLDVTLVGLGCNNFGRRVPDVAGTRAVVDAALDAGVTFFDTADIYGGSGRGEELLGEVLEGRRDRVVLATKFGMDMKDDSLSAHPRGSRDYIRRAVEGSLRRLRTDVIDLYQYHEPDGVTPIAETLGALDELVREGKIRHAGCSNFSAAQLQEAEDAARENGTIRFESLQNRYSLMDRRIEADVLPLCERLGVAVLPYYPLHRGLLTGKYRRGERAPEGTRLADREAPATEEEFDRLEALEAYARERGVTLLDVAIAVLAARPAVASVIAGATKPEQVVANARALSWTPSAADLAALPA